MKQHKREASGLKGAGSVSKNLDATDALAESLRIISHRFNQGLAPVLKKLDEHLLEIGELTRLPRMTSLNAHLVNFQRSLQDAFRPFVEQIQKSLCELPPRTQQAIRILGAHGWYLDMEMPIPNLWQLSSMLDEGNAQEAENSLVEYFESRVDGIEESIVGRFPHRKGVVSAAFSAHRRGDYVLSIPVLLAQTDGICQEVMKCHFFQKSGGKPRTARTVEKITTDTLKAALLTPLTEPLPITASEHERTTGWQELNRHMVLHGESLDYGNKVNALKAISLINYLIGVLALLNEQGPEHGSS